MNGNQPQAKDSGNRLRIATITGLAGVLALGAAGCKGKNQAQIVNTNGQDPADANMAQPYTGGNAGGYNGQTQNTSQVRVAGQSQSYTPQSSSENYETQEAAPIIRQKSTRSASPQYYPVPQAGSSQASYQQGDDQQAYADQSGYDQGYSDAEDAGAEALAEADQPPPPLPVYDQPAAPEDDYLWTPGYWNYANAGYYWVPGAWVAPPFIGALWTPPYWGYNRGRYICHRGYWGHHVGYYGGVNYGFGYVGIGYFGGYWHNRDFYYNRAVTNVNVTNVHNVYNRTVIVNNITYGPRTNNYTSYNGGRGGLNVQPRPQELTAMHEAHFAPVAAQRENRLAAQDNRAQFFAANHGRPEQAFAGHAFGNVRTIAPAPHEQPFNHPVPGNTAAPNAAFTTNRPGQPGFNNRPGQPGFNNRPGVPNQPNAANNRPGAFDRPGTPNQPNATPNRPGELNRPGAPNQPNAAINHPGGFNGPGAPNQPDANRNHPGEAARPGSPDQPDFRRGRPGDTVRPAVPNQSLHENRPAQLPQPGNTNRTITPNQPAAVQPGNAPGRFGNGRPENFHRDAPVQAQPAQVRPNAEPQHFPAQTSPEARPGFGQRPAFNAPQARPEVAAPRSAPPVAPHPAPAAPAPARPAAPVAAPHVGGGAPHAGGPHPH